MYMLSADDAAWLRDLGVDAEDSRVRWRLKLITEGVDRAVRGCLSCGSLHADPHAEDPAMLRLCHRCAETFKCIWVDRVGPRDHVRPDAMTGLVYFGRMPDTTIKIGVSTQVPRRMVALEAELLATEEGGTTRESELHHLFRHLRLRPDREFFRPAPDLLGYIAAVAGSAGGS